MPTPENKCTILQKAVRHMSTECLSTSESLPTRSCTIFYICTRVRLSLYAATAIAQRILIITFHPVLIGERGTKIKLTALLCQGKHMLHTNAECISNSFHWLVTISSKLTGKIHDTFFIPTQQDHTSSRMYIGAGRNSSRDKISDNVSKDRWPPLSSDKLCFHMPPNATQTSKPCRNEQPSGGCSFASHPGSRVENILLKLSLTLCHVSSSCSSLFTSTVSMT